MKKILVTCWGKPEWKEIEYEFRNDVIVSKNPLPLLIKHIQPSRTIILVLDTVAGEGKNYQVVKEKIKKYYMKFIKNELGLSIRPIIVVAPGVGYFPNGIFKGELQDFYYYSLYKLSKLLISREKQMEIHFDMTHGINFMSVMTYRAIKLITGILAMRKKIFLQVYNSDPYTELSKRLRINIVEQGVVKPHIDIPFLVNTPRFLESNIISEEEKKKIYKEKIAICRKIDYKEINAFLSSILYGLPLALYIFYPDRQRLKNCLEKVEKIYTEHIKISRENKSITIDKQLHFNDEFLIYVCTCLLAETIGKKRLNEVSIKDIIWLKKNIFKENKMEIFIDREVKSIKEITEKLKENKWVSLKTIFKGGGLSKRNFLAHSGLENNVTQIKLMDKKLILRYDPSQLKHILSLICKE